MTAGAQFGIIKNRKFFTPDAEQKEDVTMGELTNEKKIEEAIYKLIEETFPLLDSEEARESFLGQLDRLAQWVKVMPRALDPEKKLSREEFEAAMAGLEERKDPHFGENKHIKTITNTRHYKVTQTQRELWRKRKWQRKQNRLFRRSLTA